MNAYKSLMKLASLAVLLAGAFGCDTSSDEPTEAECLGDCGTGCPAPEYWVCATDGERYCSDCQVTCLGLDLADDSDCGAPEEEESNVDECIEACGEGCPAPEYWVCASNGERYCNECVIGCYDLEVADDSACEAPEEEESNVDECIEACGVGCPAPEYRICASDGERYCSECVIGCYDLEVADDSTCE